LRRDGGVPDGLGAHLASTGVYISVRGTALRVTPHVYNDDEDVDRLIEALETFEG
jgi:selenocysteine lyase/cysteine desulfurase